MKSKILTLIRYLIAAAALIMLVLYTFPISLGISSIGNYLGIVLSLGIMVFCLFPQKIKNLILNFRKRTFGKIIVNLMCTILCLCTLYIIAGTGLMIYACNKAPESGATVIVLGCQVRGTNPSLMLERRIQAAIEYLQAHPDSSCIVSGGKGQNEAISEAQCMYNYMTSNGISPERIYMEDKSETTEQNLKLSKEIIEKNNLNSSIAIVTDGFHEFRAGYIASKINFDSIGAVPAKTPIYFLPCYHMRELVAIINETVIKNLK